MFLKISLVQPKPFYSFCYTIWNKDFFFFFFCAHIYNLLNKNVYVCVCVHVCVSWIYISFTTRPPKQNFSALNLGTNDPWLRLKSKTMLIVLDFNSIKNICNKYDTYYTITNPQNVYNISKVGDHAFLVTFINV